MNKKMMNKLVKKIILAFISTTVFAVYHILNDPLPVHSTWEGVGEA